VAAALDAELTARPGVAWARTVPALGRVVLALDGETQEEVAEAVSISELVETIERVEAHHGVARVPFPSDQADHPGDREPVDRELMALAADGLALGVAVAGRMARVARMPIELAAVVPFVQAQPWLRHRLQSALGRLPVDVGLALTNAAAAAVSQGSLGLLVDAGQRVLLLREASSANRAWQAAEPVLTAGTAELPTPVGPAGGGAVDEFADRRSARPGPAEAYANVAGPVALLAGAGAGLFSAGSGLRRAASVALAGTPKAAVLGVDAYAAELHRVLVDRGVVCFDRGALRRLDRIDSVLVDGAVLRAGNGAEAGDDLASGAQELVDAAHRADFMVAVADRDAQLVDRLGADLLVDGGDRLADSVRMLQDDGCGTLLIAGGGPSAGRAWPLAECGIGLVDAGGRPPWGAQLVSTDGGLENAVLTVEAAALARKVSRVSAAASLGGSAAGALVGVTGSATPGRSLAVVNLAALAAMGHGLRQAGGLAAPRLESGDGGPPWHALPSDEVLERLGSSPEGLSDDEAARRLTQLPETSDRGLGLWEAFADEVVNPFTPVLAGAAGLSAAVGSPADAGLVASVVGLNAVIGAAQRVRVDRAVRALADASADDEVRVRRGGRERRVAAAELAPGDVIVLEAGDAVPADCRIIRASSVEVDESSLTGESLPVPKSADPTDARAVADRSSMLYQATAVSAGKGEAVVVAVGVATEAGRAATGEAVISRGVEERIAELTRLTLPVAVAGGLIVTGTGLLRRQPLRGAVAPGVSLGVAAVPEGLPLLATVSQLSGAKRLAGRGALARNPQAIDALGRVGVLCVDKTGTLTSGRIELGVVSDGVRDFSPADLTPTGVRIVAASLRATPQGRPDEDLPHLTDQAVLNGAARADVAVDEEIDSWRRRAELPFEPARGYHAVLGRNGRSSLLCVKGAPEVVLPRCDTWVHPDGPGPLDDEARGQLEDAVERLARRGHRVLAVAERKASSRRDLDDDRAVGLHFLGFLGLVDPVRPEAREGVARLREAGVRVVMVTGDHPSTAEGIARELGIGDGGRTLTGAELDELGEEKLDLVVDDVAVFARVTPSHKVRIVDAYRRRGGAVAMTGDGANDAPAIRLADVGVALGENATPAARDAADLVVPDGRIETIVAAIVEGRAMWGTLREALAILLGGNLGEIGFTVAGTVVGGRPPLNARQLLLVNLMTDVAPSMAVAVRPPRDVSPEDLLHEGPDVSLGSSLQRAIALRAVTTAAGAGAAWTLARLTGTARRASTVGLAALVGTQLAQTLVTGGSDPLVFLAVLGSAVALAGVIQTPGISQFFGCTPLGPLGWSIALSCSVGATALGVAIAPIMHRFDRAGSGT
jgi:cation-transporting P-type ATPase I